MAEVYYDSGAVDRALLTPAVPLPPNLGDGCNVIYPRDSRDLGDLPPNPPPPYTPSPPTTAPPGTPFGGLLGGGGTWAVDASDMLRFSIWVTGGPKEVAFNGRLVRDNGVLSRWSHRVTGNSATVPATKIVAAGSGLISQVSAISTTGVGAAIIDVLAELGHEEGGMFVTEAILLQGRLSDQGIASPTISTGGGGGGGGGGSGCCMPIPELYEPDNDSSILIDVSVGPTQRKALSSYTMRVETSATAGNRLLGVFTQDLSTGQPRLNAMETTVQTAGLNGQHTAQLNGTTGVSAAGGVNYLYQLNLGQPTWYNEDFQIYIQLTNVQAGDLLKFAAVWVDVETVE